MTVLDPTLAGTACSGDYFCMRSHGRDLSLFDASFIVLGLIGRNNTCYCRWFDRISDALCR